MKKSIIAFMAAIFLFFSLPMAYADYTSWEDSTYDFKSVKAVYIDAIDTSESGITSAARDMKLKEDFYRRVSKIKGPKVQAAQPEAETPGTLETEAVSTEVKDKAPSIVPKEAADGGSGYLYLSEAHPVAGRFLPGSGPYGMAGRGSAGRLAGQGWTLA